MRRTVITRLQRYLLLATVAITCGAYHSVKTAHGPGWSWWGYVVILTGLILTEVILRSRTETASEKRERTHAARARRWTRQMNRKWQADRKAWLRNQGRHD